MKPYIFTERNGIHIIDLQQTVKMLNTAFGHTRCGGSGVLVLFVGTKRRPKKPSGRGGSSRHAVCYRAWLGGMLTNWSTMYARIQELDRWRPA